MRFGIVFFLMILLGLVSNGSAGQKRPIILATTTSTQDSGLLDELLPVFEKETGYRVKTIAVGSGQAMALGRRGEADILLVHSPAAEQEFLAQGYGIGRTQVMYNDFVIVGPAADPARIGGMSSARGAISRISSSGSLFISRGDDSGTHQLEKKLWRDAALKPDGNRWYQQTGLGMGQTLSVAAEKKGYTLSDRGTFLALQKGLGLKVLVEGDPLLLNIYHLIEVNPVKWPKVNSPGAQELHRFLVSEKAQRMIGSFGAVRFGSPLFTPAAGKVISARTY